jgi:hypothetical protein
MKAASSQRFAEESTRTKYHGRHLCLGVWVLMFQISKLVLSLHFSLSTANTTGMSKASERRVEELRWLTPTV